MKKPSEGEGFFQVPVCGISGLSGEMVFLKKNFFPRSYVFPFPAVYTGTGDDDAWAKK
jgi:hypothetical protein